MVNADIEELIEKIKIDFKELSEKAANALSDDEIKSLSAIQIKQIADNIRSALDYMAIDIIQSTGITTNIKKIYFPYGKSLQKLESMNKWMIDLKNKNPSVYNAIIQYQDFSIAPNDKWIIQLCNLSITVKHHKLERPQRVDQGRTTRLGGWLEVDDTSTVTIGEYNYQDKESGLFKTVKNVSITPTTKTKDLKENFKGDTSQYSVSFNKVSFLTSSGDDVVQILDNSIKALEAMYPLIYKNL
ncbi:hypothetical protein ACWASX_005589 [Klebsiella variicola]